MHTLCGAQVFVPLPCPQCGRVSRARGEIAGYQLYEVLARSGLGIILRAVDPAGMPLAVKLLQPPLASEPSDIEYFASEVWAIARLNHPHCLRIFATGVEQGTAWIAMEWLSHGSLADRLAERGRLREAEVLAIGVQAAAALGAAHAAGHHHRDLEPNNLVFADPRTLKITDFGQAALYQIAADDLGTMWGRACYVSPERLRAEPEEAHSDIYSLGAVLFHALTGGALHDGELHAQLVLDLVDAGDVRVEGLVTPLHDKTALVLNRMLTSEPAQRYQDWSEVSAQLTQAGTLVARRDAPSLPTPPPAGKKIPARATPSPRRDSSLVWAGVSLAFLAITLVLGISVWKKRGRLPPARVAVTHPRPPAASPTPLPATPIATPLPATPASGFDWRGWKTASLESARGTVKTSASFVPPSGALRLLGSGSGIAGERDDCGFHFRTVEGNWTLTTHVRERDGAAGLSVRAAPTVGSVGLSVWLTSSGTVAAGTRKKADTKPELISPVAGTKATWLRINRRGASFTAEYSTNAQQWKTIAKLDGVPMSPKPVAGFIVWSDGKAREAVAVFDRVTYTPAPRKAATVNAASPPRSPQPRSGSPPSSPPARGR